MSRFNRILHVAIVPFYIFILSGPALARLPEPDHVIYGTAMLNGELLAGQTLSLVLEGQSEAITSYQMGSNPALGNQFALRIPMDLGEPQRENTARNGDGAHILIDGQEAVFVRVGEPGAIQSLDFDSDLVVRIPGLSLADASGAERDAGAQGTHVVVELKLAYALPQPVLVNWSTADGTATGGADYKIDSGSVTIPIGQTRAEIEVTIFDDLVSEGLPQDHIFGEHFYVRLDSPVNANVLDGEAKVTILDYEDTPPAISIRNITVFEPTGDSAESHVSVYLSYPWHEQISMEVVDVPGSAEELDYSIDSNALIIPAGELTAKIDLEVFSDVLAEDNETFQIQLLNPSAGVLLDDVSDGLIMETSEVLSYVESQIDGVNGIEYLANAIDVESSPDGVHVYVVSRAENALSVFSRDPISGHLHYITSYIDGEDGLNDLGGIRSVAISPDSQFVYTAAALDAAVSTFSRDEIGRVHV